MPGQRREEITNDKLNLNSEDMLGILLAAAAALLCAVMDYFTEGEGKHD